MRSILSRVLATLAVVVTAAMAATSAAPAMAATAAGHGGYHHVSTVQIHDWSAERTAHATGLVRWYQGGGFLPVTRAEIDGSVHAFKPTGCIYARVAFNYINGSFSYPSPSLSSGSSTGGWIRSCRHGRQRMPSPISLSGIDYAKRTLNSVTITVATSHLGQKIPRYQGTEKIGIRGRV